MALRRLASQEIPNRKIELEELLATRELHKNSNRSLTLSGKVEKSKLGIESKNRYKILLADAYALEYSYISKQDFKYLILQFLSSRKGLQNVLIAVVLAEH